MSILVAALALFAGLQAPVPDTAMERQTRQLAAELRCPVCQGLSLADSPSELSQDMRNVIREQLEAGRTPEEVKEYFVGRYGEWILMEPRPQGFNLAVYILPVALLVGGAVVIAVAMRRWSRSPTRAAPVDTADPDLAPWEELTR